MQLFRDGILFCEIGEYQNGPIQDVNQFGDSQPIARRRAVILKTPLEPPSGLGVRLSIFDGENHFALEVVSSEQIGDEFISRGFTYI